MGLYFNRRKHPNVFQNQDRIPEPHQVFYRVDFLEKLLTDQKKMNEHICLSIDLMNRVTQHYGTTQSNHLIKLNSEVQAIKNTQVEQVSSEENLKEAIELFLQEQTRSNKDIATNMNNLLNHHIQNDENVKTLFEKIESEQVYLRDAIQAYFTKIIDQQTFQQKQLEQDDVKHEELRRKMEDIVEMGHVLKEQLQSIEQTQQQLIEMIQTIQESQHSMTTKLDEQEDYQTGILNRLETQEAYTDKMIRQLDHLRSIVFERAGVLVEKIEKGFKQTTSHITRLLNGGTEKQTLREFNQNIEVEKDEHEKINL